MVVQLWRRLMALLHSPKAEWDRIAEDDISIGRMSLGWIVPLLAASALASFVGRTIVGMPEGFFYYRQPVMDGLIVIAVFAGLGLLSFLLFSGVIAIIAPVFGAQRDFRKALQIAAYAPAGSLFAGLLQFIPALSFALYLGALYSIYLLFLGVPRVLKPAEKRNLIFTIVLAILMTGMIYAIYSVSEGTRPHPADSWMEQRNAAQVEQITLAREDGLGHGFRTL